MTDKEMARAFAELSGRTAAALGSILNLLWESGLDSYAELVCALKSEHEQIYSQFGEPTAPKYHFDEEMECQTTDVWEKFDIHKK